MKELRKGKNLSQEQLAEKFNVSRRTVSRWETGNNMPDMDILIELADFYGVDLREILDGERKNQKMGEEMKEVALKVTEYDNEGKKTFAKLTLVYFIIGVACIMINLVMNFFDLPETFLIGFIEGATSVMPLLAMIVGILYVTGAYKKACKHFRNGK
ncbi:MAG: helix-turn-helix domain-containing protein [Clostridia bacterium]|nr:helix-turn-helix domain-containing protein [Clostridia bacterium]